MLSNQSSSHTHKKQTTQTTTHSATKKIYNLAFCVLCRNPVVIVERMDLSGYENQQVETEAIATAGIFFGQSAGIFVIAVRAPASKQGNNTTYAYIHGNYNLPAC